MKEASSIIRFDFSPQFSGFFVWPDRRGNCLRFKGEEEGISQPRESCMGEEKHSCEGRPVLVELYLSSSGGFLFSECECLRFYCNREVRACDIHSTSESLRKNLLEAISPIEGVRGPLV